MTSDSGASRNAQPHLLALAFRAEQCPLYQDNGGMVFVGPAVEGIQPYSVCAQAVEKLFPAAQRIWSGESPEAHMGIFCGGCQGGKAFFKFRFEHEEPKAAIRELSDEAREALEASPIFRGVGADLRRRAVQLFEETGVPAGTVLIEAGTRVEALYVVVSGTFDIVQREEEGEETVVAEVGFAECLGEIGVLTGEPASASVRARTEARLVKVSRETATDPKTVMPTVLGRLAHVLASRLVRTTRRVRKELRHGLKGRLAVISPQELVQSLTVNKLSGKLTVRHQEREASVYFHDGKIGGAHSGGHTGEEAFYDFLAWERGEFRFEPGRQGQDTTTERHDPMALMLEGLRRLDEARVRRDASS